MGNNYYQKPKERLQKISIFLKKKNIKCEKKLEKSKFN